MKLSLCPQPFYPLGLDKALKRMADLGVQAFELPVDRKNPLADLDKLLAGGAAAFRKKVARYGLEISAVSNHQEGQLLLGPHHRDTDDIFKGTPEEKAAFAAERLEKTACLAAELEVGLVVGFVGCEDYSRFFPWPDPKGWESMIPVFQDRVGRLLDRFDELGVNFGHEPHPKQIVYNTETALESIDLLNSHARWGFNLDPANLMLAGVDPVVSVQALGDRIFHVHAKDGELVLHNAARSGLLAHGPWDRPDRGFRFRVPGWGDVPWKRLISELQLIGFKGYLAVENEDPVFNPLDGLKKAVAFLKPLLPEGDRQARWW
ncbi:MAG: sugar phosphate isomerase/epimerase [Planctomycetes bacterium]|nr:sugar phosphate isomerase/epimerase [Planctomycetota bacterium]